ncbi:MAG: hypothetical protein E7330_08035 [Clostridiales bacterium]|nr:hypothetical protein [Clostridiales bacterium]
MLTSSEKLIYFIIGMTRSDIRPMAKAMDVIIDLHFLQGIPKCEIKMTKHVYPQVAAMLNKSSASVERSVERLANLCWDTAVKDNMIDKLTGRPHLAAPSVSDILFYFCYLLYCRQPFFLLFDGFDAVDARIPSGLSL